MPVIALLLFWPATSLIAFSYAGEKMPWLTVHITLVMIMAAGWAFGYLIDSTPWKSLWERKGLLVLLLLPVFIASLAGALLGVLGNQPPFQGNELVQLQNTATFLLSVITVLASGAALLVLIRSWTGFEIGRAAAVVFFALLAVLDRASGYPGILHRLRYCQRIPGVRACCPRPQGCSGGRGGYLPADDRRPEHRRRIR